MVQNQKQLWFTDLNERRIKQTFRNAESLDAEVLIVAVRHLVGDRRHVGDKLVVVVVRTVRDLQHAGRKVLHQILHHQVVKRLMHFR